MSQNIWHVGVAVDDLETGKAEFSQVFGVSWRPTRVRVLTLTDAHGDDHEVECHVTFSEGGPFAVELWEAIPGTPLAAPPGGGVHHIGYWVDDIAEEGERLAALGFGPYATVGGRPLLSAGPSGTVVELCDLHSDRPQLRDLFPAGSRHAGPPVLDSDL
ncbi:VOC family protein [Promicromonospora sukumoe]|uniref:Catechol 2,3-dioxygenase-like lactoylglutathione lyase family enzyme n=1 Tax=Promicromonospora sukumoe TaxID=88382 RepID=A0A7W3PDM2_9MICO|nr:VOC family protein [Promicromonospora sukumoe]MBA8807674.1 catechol 2,3-dioxygenase-like lactoylglutathione lyase family enzyme [Promicromonospora sukumoe]